MKHIHIYLIFLAGWMLTACTSSEKKSTQRPVPGVKKTVSANLPEQDTALFYSIITPGSPVLFVVIDPHGNGRLAVSKFRKVAKELNVSVIGMNNVANNTPEFIKLIDNNIQAFKGDYKYLVMAGLSGGARMAFQYGMVKHADGIIMCGAGPGQRMNLSIPFPLVMLAGTRDFNFVEQYYPPASALAGNANLLALPFEGIHEWPGEKNLVLASKFILSKLQINQEFNDESSLINQQFNTFKKEGRLFLAFKQLEALSKIYRNDRQKKKLTDFTQSPGFNKYMDHFQAILTEEMSRNRQLMQNLNLKDEQWWNKTIDDIIVRMNDRSHPLESDSWARTKAFLGVLMYSVVNKEITNHNSPYLMKYLHIYEKLEPENPDLEKFKKQITRKSGEE